MICIPSSCKIRRSHIRYKSRLRYEKVMSDSGESNACKRHVQEKTKRALCASGFDVDEHVRLLLSHIML